MTALTEYQRLEAPGTWRPAPGAQRREVIVSVGEASLTLTDQSDRALAHWSLAALERRDAGSGGRAVYAPGPDATEDLEITDPEMISAVERVRRAVDRARPRPGRLRVRLVAGILSAVVLTAVIWVPDTLIRHAARVAPEATRAETGTRLLAAIEDIAGPACETPEGNRALAQLRTRLLGAGPGRIAVMGSGLTGALQLPGGILLLGRSLVEDYETPEVAAGYVLAERARAAVQPPMLRLLDTRGVRAAVELMTTGQVGADALAAYAEYLLTARPVAVADMRLLEAFREAGVRVTPYAYAVDVTGETSLSLIEADPVAPGAGDPILPDGAWVALQGICGE